MNKENWVKTFNGKMSIDNDGNDYYYEWVSLESDEGSLTDILQEWFELGFDPIKVRIKVMKNAIFITGIT